LPQVIFRIEGKVNHNDGGHAHHETEDGIHSQQKSVHMIELVIPQGGQNVIQFDEDGTKG
jgi:hypothetical protein